MTKLTIIELSEIRALRLTCVECGGGASLKLSGLKKEGLESLHKCPNCGRTWMTPRAAERFAEKKPAVQDLALRAYDSISALLNRLKNESDPVGFTIALEIETAVLIPDRWIASVEGMS